MTDWVRLWHEMPSDPKWRTIARKSGQRVGDVIAVFNFMMVSASANASERGSIGDGFDFEDIATALDLDDAAVQAIFTAMQGKVLDGSKLCGWEKRQPKREDSSAERAKSWREERKRTKANASERPDTETDTETETETEVRYSTSNSEEKLRLGGGAGAPNDSYAFFGKTVRLKPFDFEKWKRVYHALDIEAELTAIDAWWQEQEPASRKQWFHRTAGMLNRKHQELIAAKARAEDDGWSMMP